MKIPKRFESDLNDLRDGKITFETFLQNNDSYIRNVSRYALRYKLPFLISDEDDMYQEACYWILDSIWEYDETRGVSLVRFVTYNVGVRLAAIIRYEKHGKRYLQIGQRKRLCDTISSTNELKLEDTISSIDDTERYVAIKLAIENASNELTDLAKELVQALVEENGVFIYAVRRLAKRPHIKKRFGLDEAHLKYALKNKVLPEILSSFRTEDIIP